MYISKQEKILSDGSAVFDVQVYDDYSAHIFFHAVTEDDADIFIQELGRLIAAHTTDDIART